MAASFLIPHCQMRFCATGIQKNEIGYNCGLIYQPVIILF